MGPFIKLKNVLGNITLRTDDVTYLSNTSRPYIFD